LGREELRIEVLPVCTQASPRSSPADLHQVEPGLNKEFAPRVKKIVHCPFKAADHLFFPGVKTIQLPRSARIIDTYELLEADIVSLLASFVGEFPQQRLSKLRPNNAAQRRSRVNFRSIRLHPDTIEVIKHVTEKSISFNKHGANSTLRKIAKAIVLP
jgi:hypothetical protein